MPEFRREPKPAETRRAVWRGPEEDGVTFSLLSRFLCCRERFRLLVVEGLKPRHGFNHRVDYGNMWHVCEEALAGTHAEDPRNVAPHSVEWVEPLKLYCRDLCRQHPTEQKQIDHWYNVCKVQFPIYVDYWRRHGDVLTRTPLLQEAVFNVPYALPSGRVVRLRGKFDSVDLIGKGKAAGIYLQENKTKGDIREEQLKRQLTFDLQSMLYITALVTWQKLDDYGEPIRTPEAVEKAVRGVRYNVVRRPLSGGKGTIVRHKAKGSKPEESKESYYGRLRDIIAAAPHEFFMRWRVDVRPADIARFRRECLDPILEQLCDWWLWISRPEIESPFSQGLVWAADGRSVRGGAVHWRHPFGVYNVLDEGGVSDLDDYLHDGSELGLSRVDDLYPELT